MTLFCLFLFAVLMVHLIRGRFQLYLMVVFQFAMLQQTVEEVQAQVALALSLDRQSGQLRPIHVPHLPCHPLTCPPLPA